jgi:hypothetical protein
VPDTAIGSQIHKTLDIHRRFPAQVTFDRKLGDDVPELRHLGLRKILDLDGRFDSGDLTGDVRAALADAEYMSQRDANMLTVRDIDPRNACHALVPHPCRCL